MGVEDPMSGPGAVLAPQDVKIRVVRANQTVRLPACRLWHIYANDVNFLVDVQFHDITAVFRQKATVAVSNVPYYGLFCGNGLTVTVSNVANAAVVVLYSPLGVERIG